MRKSVKNINIKNTVKDTVETIVKPVVKPVTGLVDVFNFFMKKVEEKGLHRKGDVEIDGFVNVLLDEMKDVEQGIFAFFSEMLFMQHLSEKMAQVENEVTLVSILAERVKEFLKPGFIEVFLCGEDKTSFHLAYHYPAEKEFNPAGVKEIAAECFNKGESSIYNNRKIDGKSFSVLTAPLRTTRDRFGTIVVGRKGKNSLSSKDITLVIAGATVVSFSISNIKLVNSIIKNERLVTIGETIGGLSHDIKNILTSLESGIAIMDIALGKNDAPKLQDKCLCRQCKMSSECMEDFRMLTEGSKAVKNGYERMKELVLSMIDYSREREISLSPVNINRLIKDFLDTKREELREKKIKLAEDFDVRIKEVEADPLRVERMIGNLVNNAIDAVKGKTGIIKTGTKFSSDRKHVLLWVEDNGCGIPDESLKKIFDVFYSTKGSKGTGFGLAIVQKVVREHGGTIEVKSVVNKGTKFLIKIPIGR
ncbi:MAG: GHKL domain-containing protein [Candidatus Omnitrophica bacterium]|nr:GHKL domain-containing protein [Candidatus Omnitrophota bacterium]